MSFLILCINLKRFFYILSILILQVKLKAYDGFIDQKYQFILIIMNLFQSLIIMAVSFNVFTFFHQLSTDSLNAFKITQKILFFYLEFDIRRIIDPNCKHPRSSKLIKWLLYINYNTLKEIMLITLTFKREIINAQCNWYVFIVNRV